MAAKKGGLGKGFDALFADNSLEESSNSAVRLKLMDIEPNREQPRKQFDETLLAELADREKVSKAAIAIAWILRHPAKMQAIIGSMNPEHIKDVCAAADVTLSHHDWYTLYLAAGKFLP